MFDWLDSWKETLEQYTDYLYAFEDAIKNAIDKTIELVGGMSAKLLPKG